MLRRFIDSNYAWIHHQAVAIFCNTGKEAPGTLDFVHRMETEWGIPIVWLEFTGRGKMGFEEVCYENASRDGEPFESLIRTKQRLPNIVQRSCTQWLKILTAHRYCKHVLLWNHYDTALGLRADEPNRVAKLAPHKDTPGEEPYAPLAKAGITRRDIMAWWSQNSFDLDINPDAGNCDLCFLKGLGQRSRLIQAQPGVEDWWAEQERWVTAKTSGHGQFTKDLSIPELVARSGQLQMFADDGATECRCTD